MSVAKVWRRTWKQEREGDDRALSPGLGGNDVISLTWR
jgi:hypothetical protein